MGLKSEMPGYPIDARAVWNPDTAERFVEQERPRAVALLDVVEVLGEDDENAGNKTGRHADDCDLQSGHSGSDYDDPCFERVELASHCSREAGGLGEADATPAFLV